MIIRETFPLAAKNAAITMQWASTGPDDLDFLSSHLTFDNINVTPAGNIPKERTSLPLEDANPILWSDGAPAAVKSAFPNGPQEAIGYALRALYECDEHQYRLGTKTRPES